MFTKYVHVCVHVHMCMSVCVSMCVLHRWVGVFVVTFNACIPTCAIYFDCTNVPTL